MTEATSARVPRATNVLFATACVVVISLGCLELRDRLVGGRTTTVVRAETSAVDVLEGVQIRLAGGTTRSVGAPKVAIVEFSDFQCPFCGSFAGSTYGQIQRTFVDSGQVSYAYFNFPLERLHPYAARAGEAVECAGAQSQFWPMHDRLFAAQKVLADAKVFEIGALLGLDQPRFQACMNGEMESRVRAQVALAEELGVESTPTFMIGWLQSPDTVSVKYRIRGAQPLALFEAKLRELVDSRLP